MDNNSSALYSRVALDLARHETADETQSVAGRQLLQSLLKKYDYGNSKAADKAATDLFLQMNNHCSNYCVPNDVTLPWKQGYLIDRFRFWAKHYTWKLYDTVCDPENIWGHGGFGTGANISASGTQYYHKLYAGKITCSSKILKHLYKQYISTNSDLREAERLRQVHYGDIQDVRGSNLSFVSKNIDISRCISTEPTLNMFFQKGVDFHIRKLLKDDFGINLDHQQGINQMLAVEGSISGIYSTIDLKSASDTIATAMLQEFIDPRFFAVLDSCRSKVTVLPDNTEVHLDLFSSTGNGFTFSLQTLLFAIAVKAVYELHNLPFYCCNLSPSEDLRILRSRSTYGVNGDDIAVYSSCDSDVRLVLESLGFIINPDKSFSVGFFRESCGVDAYRGVNVRGIYIKSLATLQDIHSAYNRLAVWSSNHGIALCNTLEYLLSLVDIPQFVPPSASVTDGFRVPSVAFPKKNVPKSYTSMVEVPRSFRLSQFHMGNCFDYLKSYDKKSKKMSIVLHNPWGLMMTALNRTLASETGVLMKNRKPQVQIRRIEISDWDFGLAAASPFSGLNNDKCVERWILLTSVVLNSWSLSKRLDPARN